MRRVVEEIQEQPPARIWTDIYPTWEEACRAAKAMGGEGLTGDRWLKRIIQQISDYTSELRQYGIAMPPRSTNLPLVCALTHATAIVDFGGSSAWCWHYLRDSLPRQNVFSYTVVETEKVVGYMTEAVADPDAVRFVTLHDALDPCDVLYCNSVLQYFGSNAPLLSLVERTTPKFILLEDLVAKGDDDFFSVQAYPGGGIPYRFLGLRKLLDELLDGGYSELLRSPYASPILGVIKPLAMDNLPQINQLRYSLSILLKKSEAG